MRKSVVFGVAICLLSTVAFADVLDNPVAGFGTAGGSNARTYVFNAPYIYGDGSNIQVKWQQDLSTVYGTRRTSRSNFTFDENGDVYWHALTSPGSGLANNGEILKVSKTDGTLLWHSPDQDTVYSQPSSSVAPIVGGSAVYATRNDQKTVIALDKTTGAKLWESGPLNGIPSLTPALYNGVLYGVTSPGANATSWIYAVDTVTHAVLYQAPFTLTSNETDLASMNVTFKPDAFGQGQNGMYWCTNDPDPNQGMYCANVSTTGASVAWTNGPVRNASSNVMYNAVKDSVYEVGWGDYGASAQSFDPVTGAKKWTSNMANTGYYPANTMRADGSGIIEPGQGGIVLSITDPGDIGGAALTAADVAWRFPATGGFGDESMTMGVLIHDEVGGRDVYITGARGAADFPRRLFALDADTGEKLWEWQEPGDPNPSMSAWDFAALSVGPDGTLYYFDRDKGLQGTLFAISVPEPVTMVLLAIGGVLGLRRRK